MQVAAKVQVRQKPHRSSTVRRRAKASSGAWLQMSARVDCWMLPPT